MHDVALLSLLHDRGKLVAAIAGVALAATLLWVQVGLFVAFLGTSSAIIARIGGDVWVMARGTEVVDNGETLSAGSRSALASRACVRRVRGVVISVATMRKPSGALDYLQIVGVEPSQRPIVPWQLARGLPADLHAPDRVAIDEHDLEKLSLPDDPIGHTIEVSGRLAIVAAMTRGIRSFALYPYVFSEIDNARHLANLAEGQAQYWVADLESPACARDVIAAISGSQRDLDAHTTAEFERMTESYWVFGSGAGGALAFCALFSLLVGAVIVAQTLYSITKEHERELATLKAMGATPRELISFVAWQASFLALVGGAIGVSLTAALRDLLSREGIEIALTLPVFGIGAFAVLAMCALASVPSVRRVLE
ncbi:MAG TPA: ABC transporter permease, partial [Polyangiales bacterium]|nr:ABC transporter permease [Polyangiales bacterium]